MIKDCYDKSKALLEQNLEKLHFLAKELLLKESLKADEVYRLLEVEAKPVLNLRNDLRVISKGFVCLLIYCLHNI